MITAHHPTVPESPATLALQIQQLKDGIRNVVMFPTGTPVPGKARDIGMRDIVTAGNRFWFNPTKIKAGDIAAAAKKNELPKILGHNGYGAPDKSKLSSMPLAVVAKDKNGVPAQDIATDTHHLPQAIAGAQRVTPPGGSVKIETPAKVISERLQKKGNESAEVFRGSSNIDLSPQGIQEAKDAAKRTAAQFTEIYASPLKRAQDTAGIVGKYNPQAGPIKTTLALEPWFLGQHEGQAVTPERLADIEDRIRNRPNDPVPGRGPQSTGAGESFNQFKDPLIQHVQNQVANFRPGNKPLNVTHYRDVQAIKAWLKAGHPTDRSIDIDEMVHKGSQHPGDLFRLHPKDMRLMPAKDAKQDGIYFLRHGATAWNAENAGGKPVSEKINPPMFHVKQKPSPRLMADGGVVGGGTTAPAIARPVAPRPVDPNMAVKNAMRNITHRAASGDVLGALNDGAQNVNAGILRPQHVERAMDLAGPNAIKSGFNALPELHQAVSVFRNARPEHQALFRPLLHQRITNMEKRPAAEQRAVFAKLAQHGFVPGRSI